jgi:hypothetical protein
MRSGNTGAFVKSDYWFTGVSVHMGNHVTSKDKFDASIESLTTGKYHYEVRAAVLGDITIPVEIYTPILSSAEYAKRHDETERVLFNIYVKYQKQSKQAI